MDARLFQEFIFHAPTVTAMKTPLHERGKPSLNIN